MTQRQQRKVFVPDAIARQIEVPKDWQKVVEFQTSLKDLSKRMDDHSSVLPGTLLEAVERLFGHFAVRGGYLPVASDGSLNDRQRRATLEAVNEVRDAFETHRDKLDYELLSVSMSILLRFGLKQWAEPHRERLKELRSFIDNPIARMARAEQRAELEDLTKMVAGANLEPRGQPPCRENKRGFVLYLEETSLIALRTLASKEGTSLQKYLNDMVDEHIDKKARTPERKARRSRTTNRLTVS